MLCGARWTACNVIMSLGYDDRNYDFSHDNERKLPAWNEHKVVSWRLCSNMKETCERMRKVTDVSRAKCTHMRKQGVEDDQTNGCVPDEVTQQTGHIKSSFFNAYCTVMNQNMLHASSGFDAQKEAYVVMRWNVNVNNEEYPLVENATLSKMDIARRLTPKHDEHSEQCKRNAVKWPCLDNFIFHLLPFLSEVLFKTGCVEV